MDTRDAPRTVPVPWLVDAVTTVFRALGFSGPAAGLVAETLVAADMRGIGSHGVMLVPMYVERIQAGSVSRREAAESVSDLGAVAVLDGGHALGQLTGDQAMRLAVAKAHRFGVGAVTVRNAFHFGGAFRYVQLAAADGCIGIAAANTRPLMPAPGGAAAVVGNNPVAVGVPRPDGAPVVLDIALSEAALGKVRLAASGGRTIPASWATDRQGRPTTDPGAALDGLLLPTGGHKGYGLAFMVDVLAGVLSGGGYGRHVRGLYADTSVPNDCAHFFLALDVAAFGDPAEFGKRLADLADQVLTADLAPDVDRVYLPGDIEATRYARALRAGVSVEPAVLTRLRDTAASLGVPVGEPDPPADQPVADQPEKGWR
ncbi:Ldh family oxidoreductase [Plantactinospora sp. GCM10030261]|uniref:Ldh family oxidoreductase n=1 Tax=Plantactinospora sp. GCM10030261 TaxID=3273420 RepID=UPI003608B075